MSSFDDYLKANTKKKKQQNTSSSFDNYLKQNGVQKSSNKSQNGGFISNQIKKVGELAKQNGITGDVRTIKPKVNTITKFNQKVDKENERLAKEKKDNNALSTPFNKNNNSKITTFDKVQAEKENKTREKLYKTTPEGQKLAKEAVKEEKENLKNQLNRATKIGKTTGNILTNVGKGALDAIENIVDFPHKVKNYAKDKFENLTGLKVRRDFGDERVRLKEITGESDVDKLLKTVGWDEQLLKDWEKDSLVKHDNLGGQISQAGGGLAVDLIGGQILNPATAELASSLEKTKLFSKLSPFAKKYAISNVQNLGSTTSMAGRTFSSAYTKAKQEGANDDQAFRYAFADSVIEIGTEFVSGGIPGTNGIGSLDKVIDAGIDKVKNKAVKSILNYGYSVIGEGAEEALSNILETKLRKYTYDPKAKIDWNDVIKDTIAGGILGGVLQAPGTISEIANSSNTNVDTNVENNNKKNIIDDYKKIKAVKEIQEQVQNNEIGYEEANNKIKRVQEGTYEQQNDLNQIAQKQVTEVINNPNLSQEAKTQQINAITQTLAMKQQQINQNTSLEQQNVANNESLQQKSIINQDNRNKSISADFANEIQNKTRKTHENNNNVEFVDINKLVPSENNGGYRTNEQVTELENDIKQNGIVTPIEISIDDNGKVNIENGNHRLLVANELGLQEVPVIITNDKLEILNNKDYNNSMNKYLEERNANKNSNETIRYDAGFRTNEGYSSDNRVESGNRGATTGNDRLSNQMEGYNNGSSSTTTRIENSNEKSGAILKDKGTSDSSFSNDNIAEKRTKAEEILKINSDGTSEMVSDRPRILEEMPSQKKGKKSIREEMTDMAIAFTNRNAELDRISKETKNHMLKTETDRLGLAPSESQQNIGKAQRNNDGIIYKNFTDKNGNKTSMSIDGIWEDAKASGIKNKTLQEYLVAQLNLDRLDQGVDQFNIPAYESEETISKIEKDHPEIKRVAENVWQYQKNQLQKKVDAGLITREQQNEYLEKTPHYVRIQRDVNKTGSNVSSTTQNGIKMKNTIQKVKGSVEDILPIRETMAQYEIESTNAIRKNNVLKELAKSLNYEESAGDTNIIIDEDMSLNDDLIKKNKDGSYSATFFKNGEAVEIPINRGIYEALNGKMRYDWENWKVMKIPRSISAVQRGLLTDKNPLFMATNFFKDFGDAPLNSKYGTGRFLKNYPRAIKDLTTKGNYSRLYEALGGSDNSYFRDGQFTKESQSKISKAVDKALTPIEVGNEFIEKLPRLTEFISTIEANGYTVGENGELVAKKGTTPKKSSSEALSEALYNAAEITTNFKRGGKITKAINRNGATFLNASVQGFSKQIRNFTEIQNPKQAVRLLGKAVVLGITPALLSDLIYQDDDDYEDLPDYIKDEYYLFKGKDGKWIRIPKGRAISVFGSAARYSKQIAEGKEKASEAFGKWTDLAKTQIAPNSVFDNNVFAPISQVKNNKSWSGNKIVSDSLSNKAHPEEEFDAKTSELSKWLGKALKKSPKKIDYLIDQYTGGIGDVALPLMTNYAEGEDDTLFGKIIKNPIKSKFTTDSVLNNKSVSEFYDTMEKLEGQKKYSKATKKDKAKYSYIYSASQGISELYKQQREIENSTTLSDSEKYKQARDKQKEIIAAMKDAMDKVKNAQTEGSLTKIGDKYYQEKTEKDGTKKVSKINDKTVNKAKELGIDIDIYQKAVNDIYNIHDIKNSYGKVTKTRKQQVIDYIQGLKLTAEEKQRLYRKYYKK